MKPPNILAAVAGCDKPETKQLRDLMSHQVSFFHERRMYDGDDAKLVKATCILTPDRTAIEIEEEKVTFMQCMKR